jgi:hypothetical protein
LYPLRELEQVPIVNDSIADQRVLVVYHRSTGTALAFDRTVGGRAVQFELAETTKSDMLVRDMDTGTVWSGITGQAQEGFEASPQLRQLRTSQFVVSKWHKHFPGSSIFGTR